jgi:hypothetical protein
MGYGYEPGLKTLVMLGGCGWGRVGEEISHSYCVTLGKCLPVSEPRFAGPCKGFHHLGGNAQLRCDASYSEEPRVCLRLWNAKTDPQPVKAAEAALLATTSLPSSGLVFPSLVPSLISSGEQGSGKIEQGPTGYCALQLSGLLQVQKLPGPS